jgi:hypothetical protein
MKGGMKGDDQVPRLPRGKGLRMRSGDFVRIAMFATLLVMVLALGRPCASGVAGFVDSFSPPPDAAAPAPAIQELQLERLTDEEIKRRFPADEGDEADEADEADGAARPASGPPEPR